MTIEINQTAHKVLTNEIIELINVKADSTPTKKQVELLGKISYDRGVSDFGTKSHLNLSNVRSMAASQLSKKVARRLTYDQICYRVFNMESLTLNAGAISFECEIVR